MLRHRAADPRFDPVGQRRPDGPERRAAAIGVEQLTQLPSLVLVEKCEDRFDIVVIPIGEISHKTSE
ncbi:hypothetical protein [Sphingomonas sanxanigenens]|uniref:Uncharacterized protein n=1 Tax=Sphingomonas sanxanigenens DSM 19645 = NX02 TaxID=1123269 RepID=W0AJ14_9SPHN|nr:hypothetical protein [Sphingomonas sanxanigenens]AHE55650.1 hypothetical protein NX02_19955 [Sphingomonas sanxanigenens DSM 19645 = NX02]